MSPRPGEVWLADLGLAGKTRLTSQNRHSRYEVVLPRLSFLDRDSIANVQGLGSIPSVRLERKLGRISVASLSDLKAALIFALDLV